MLFLLLLLGCCNLYLVFFPLFSEPRATEMADKPEVLEAVLKEAVDLVEPRSFSFVLLLLGLLFLCFGFWVCVEFGFFLVVVGVGEHTHRGGFSELEV